MKKTITTICGVLFLTAYCCAQQAVLHENIVRPSMTAEYHAAVMKIKEACAANKVDMAWTTFAFEDNSYAHALRTNGDATLETDLWTDLKAKIGQENFNKLVEELGRSVESQIQGVLNMMPNHGYGDPRPDETYRKILLIFPLAGKEQETEDLFLEWKKAFQDKKSPLTFHVYKTSYGPDHGYVVSFPAKDAADLERKGNETHTLIGETQSRLWKKQMSLTRKYFWKRGYFIPELGYAYSPAN